MRAGNVNGVNRGSRSYVRIKERWTYYRGNNVTIAVSRDRSSVAICDSESRHALFFSKLHCVYSIFEALTEADGHQQILRGQNFDFMLQSTGASRRCFSIEPKPQQPVRKIICQSGGEV